LRRALAALLALILSIVTAATARAELPVTGRALPGLAAFDSAVTTLLEKWKIPGASLAVAKDGRLIMSRGYGYSDMGQLRPVTPDLRFRMASLSKSLTATAVMKLVEEGRLDLDDAALPLLGSWAPAPHEITDPRVYRITVRHLLVHRGGWNREMSGDPSFDSREHLNDADCRGIMRDELSRKLDFEPGTSFSYSNTGYCVLGRIIERVSGMPYADFVRHHILAPAGANDMALTRKTGFRIDEPVYYQTPGSVISPYEGIALDAIDSLAGWVSRPTDYLRYFLALNGFAGKSILKPQSVAQMFAAPPSAPKPPPNWYGLGVRVQARSGGLDLWHHGSMPGTQAEVVLSREGVAWVIAFNARPADAAAFSDDIDATLWAAARRTTDWPAGNLFE
jgi:CubicO group peptidase (beta-lactamase class C family)